MTNKRNYNPRSTIKNINSFYWEYEEKKDPEDLNEDDSIKSPVSYDDMVWNFGILLEDNKLPEDKVVTNQFIDWWEAKDDSTLTVEYELNGYYCYAKFKMIDSGVQRYNLHVNERSTFDNSTLKLNNVDFIEIMHNLSTVYKGVWIQKEDVLKLEVNKEMTFSNLENDKFFKLVRIEDDD